MATDSPAQASPPPAGQAGATAGLRGRIEGSPYNSAVLMLVLGLVLLAVAVVRGTTEYVYRTQGRVTDAVVLRSWGTGAKANASYRFVLPDGRAMTSTQGGFRPARNTIRIQYVPAHPWLSRVIEPDMPPRGAWYVWMALGGIGLIGFSARLASQARRGVQQGLFVPEEP